MVILKWLTSASSSSGSHLFPSSLQEENVYSHLRLVFWWARCWLWLGVPQVVGCLVIVEFWFLGQRVAYCGVRCLLFRWLLFRALCFNIEYICMYLLIVFLVVLMSCVVGAATNLHNCLLSSLVMAMFVAVIFLMSVEFTEITPKFSGKVFRQILGGVFR